ncbi:MAG: hypothetical protein K0S93_95 [Nitrososphaeraceae archaeon]|jgi:hypothetical protein|nr:hypothetical protein [Nitrososphaeraceae archaeon]
MKSNLDYILGFLNLLNEYALEPNKNLTKDDIKLKRRVIKHIKLFYIEEDKK